MYLKGEVMKFKKSIIFIGSALLFFTLFAYPVNAATLPAGFSETTVVSGLSYPLALAFLPDGRMLVTEQAGRVRLIVNGALQSTPLLDITGDVRGDGEMGLLGMAVDPDFPTRPYIYLYYTNDSPAAQYAVRVTLAGDLSDGASTNLTIDVAERVYLLNDIPHVNSNHNGGTMRFGPDGMLYISIGDDDIGCNAQDRTILSGEILRIKVDDTITIGADNVADKASLVPSDNPFASSADANEKLVWAYGLRNPYRFTIDPVTGDLVIGDVGASSREEISLATTGGMNFGWPYWEGDQTYYTDCGGDNGTMPILAYDNPGEGSSVIGGPMYRGVDWPFDDSFPPEYEGVIFLSDVYTGFLKALKNDGSGNWSLVSPLGLANNNFGTGLVIYPVDMIMGPNGAIYYVSLYGSVLAITYKNPTPDSVPPAAPNGLTAG